MVTEIRAAHFLEDTAEALLEWLQGIGTSDALWGDWRFDVGYPSIDTTPGERQGLGWIDYSGLGDRRDAHGGRLATGATGFLLECDFEIGLRTSARSGWGRALLQFGAALVYKLAPPFGPPSALSDLGLNTFVLDTGEKTEPTQDRPHMEQTWILRVTVPVVEATS